MARLLSDENIHPFLVERLRASGHDVATATECGLIGASDEIVLERSNREERILLTADKDFGLILEFGYLSGRGRVVLLRYRLLDWDRMSRDISAVLRQVEEGFRGDSRMLVVLSEGQYRVRHSTSP